MLVITKVNKWKLSMLGCMPGIYFSTASIQSELQAENVYNLVEISVCVILAIATLNGQKFLDTGASKIFSKKNKKTVKL